MYGKTCTHKITLLSQIAEVSFKKIAELTISSKVAIVEGFTVKTIVPF